MALFLLLLMKRGTHRMRPFWEQLLSGAFLYFFIDAAGNYYLLIAVADDLQPL